MKKNRKEAQAEAFSKRQERKRLKQAQVAQNSLAVNPLSATRKPISPEALVISNPNLDTGANPDVMRNDEASSKRNKFKSSKPQNTSVETYDSSKFGD